MIHKTYEEYLNSEMNEGLKEWTIGAMLLITSIMTPSKLDAQVNNVSDKEKTINSIENVANNPDELNKVATYLANKGFGNVNAIKTTISKNAENLIGQIEDEDGRTSTVSTTDPAKAVKYLRQGYCFTQAEITTLIDTIYKDIEDIAIDTVSINGLSEDFFDFGSIVLKDNIKSDLKSVADSILKSGNKITNIRILTGTDSVRIEPGGDLEKSGIHNNQELCNARANIIKDYLGSIGIDTSMSTVCVAPHNIENKQGFQPDEKLRIAKVEIMSLPISTPAPETNKQITTTTTTNFTLVKNIKSLKPKSGDRLKITTNKASSINKKLVGKKIKCATWN